MSADRIPVAILGATGLVGQHMIRILADHPWFRIGELAASDASTGHVYRDVARWALASELPADIAGMAVKASHGGFESTLVLSALPSEP
ncbi:MAG: aspartate-semialdehyde dehydrogenase, partial [Gemmatimonadota bacterium]|nr:aspartate-semialdehyde dehydrogenase [Gemmatimonadota bacterium]